MHSLNEHASALPSPTSIRAIMAYWVTWVIWMPLFIPSLLSLFQSHPAVPWLLISLSGAALFFSIYLWTSWQNARYLASSIPLPRATGAALWMPVIVMALLSAALASLNGMSWGSLFIYTAACASGRLSARQSVRVLAVLLLLIIVLAGLIGHVGGGPLLSALVFVAIPSVIVIALVRSVTTNQQLGVAREEMARLAAITEERLRIARDLHDLLGHNLSLIALKSELAGRLIPASPERAAAEVGDIERVARSALREVREAVAGYRQPTLSGELHNARDVLSAAGIEYQREGDGIALGTLPAPAEATLAWAVREGVTNVIRHGHARQCAIRVIHDDTGILLEIRNDGQGDSEPERPVPTNQATTNQAATDRQGNGLRGLHERVAALGGHVEAVSSPSGGFRLTVWIPVVVPNEHRLPFSDGPRAFSIAPASGPRDEQAVDEGGEA